MNLPFTQTSEYLSWHQAVGTKTYYLDFGFAVAGCVILKLRIGKVLYVPYGPVFFAEATETEKQQVLAKLKEIGQVENCVFVRFEENQKKMKKDSSDLSFPPDSYPLPAEQFFYGHQNLSSFSFFLIRPSVKTFANEGIFQPRVEWWLDLDKSEEELLDAMHKDHRYSIRRAQKEIIETEIINLDGEILESEKQKYFEHFWRLLTETGERDGFILYDKKYYEQIFKSKNPPTQSSGETRKFLVFTKIKKEVGNFDYLSVALIVISGKRANLVFAGSTKEMRELGFNHLMQWEAIKASKRIGCEVYNFGGITETVDGFTYGRSSLKGVTNFKKKFGGYIKFHGNFVDMPLKKARYFLYLLKKMF